MIEFRSYQNDIITEGYKILSRLRIVMLAMEVRTGKTLTSLGIANKMNINSVLFVTKKKAISSIDNDYNLLKPNFKLNIINYESLHKVKNNDFDLFIIDESHSIGAFPKPSKRAKDLKDIVGDNYCILLSGTPTPESWSQIYHQFWISNFSPFEEKSFYKWAHNYVNVTKAYVSHGNMVNNYSNANENLIKQKTSKNIISFSQKEAGFNSIIDENVLYVDMKPITYKLVNKLEKDFIINGKKGVILADTSVKLLQKVHQLYSGTVKLEDGKSVSIDDSKAVFIKDKFLGKKIVIFYKFKEELNLLKSIFKDSITTELNEFNFTEKNIALQIASGREGLNLSKADFLIYFNIDFSATSYWQSRDRMTTKERKENKVYWIFSKGGIEEDIYKKVLSKKSYTTKHYERKKISNKIN